MANVPSVQCALAVVIGCAATTVHADVSVERQYRVSGGTATLRLTAGGVRSLAIHASAGVQLLTVNGSLNHVPAGELWLAGGDGDMRVIFSDPAANEAPIYAVDADDGRVQYLLAGADLSIDPAGESFRVSAPLIDGGSVGGMPKIVGQFMLDANLSLESEYVFVHAKSGPVGDFATPPDGRGFPNAGPDLITGNVSHLHEYGREGDRISVAAGTTACNKGDVPVRWQAFPSVDHPVMTLNFYRLKDDRFEQLGYSWVKHGFGASQLNACQLGCTPGCPFQALCPGCSDPYTANQIAEQTSVTGRNWINPFTGVFAANINNHTGHVHDALSHRLTLEDADIAQDQGNNASARYFSEGMYICPHEYLPNNGVANNQHNNVTHRELAVTGATGTWYGFAPLTDDPIRESPALDEWTGATQVIAEPAAGADGRAILAYKVTQSSGGGWHYEYALYNQNLDRAIQSFHVPVGTGAAITNISFHAPRHEAGCANDGTVGGAGLSNAPWNVSVGTGAIEWSTESFAANPNASAIRWGTLYNFGFDSDQPPTNVLATIGYFKTATTGTIDAVGPISVCPGDVNGDGIVNLDDLTVLLSNFGASGAGSEDGDIDGNSIVDLNDLTLLLSAYGTSC